MPLRIRLRMKLALAALLIALHVTTLAVAVFPRPAPGYQAYFIDHTRRCWPTEEEAEQMRHLALPDRLRTDAMPPLTGCAIFTSGWKGPSSGGVWTVGPASTLTLPVNASVTALRFSFVTYSWRFESLRLRMRVIGSDQAPVDMVFPAGRIVSEVLPLPPSHGAFVEIELHIDNPESPLFSGEGLEWRPLGANLLEIEFQHAAP